MLRYDILQTPKETGFAIYRGKRKTNNVRTLFEELKNKFIELQKECNALREENIQLKARLAEIQSEGEVAVQVIDDKTAISINSSPNEKIALFMSLFKGREDVYPTRWENVYKSGYSPVYVRSMGQIVDKEDREYLPVTGKVVTSHLSGQITMGIYPLTLDDRCYFLAIDFDKKTWRDDCKAVLESCKFLEVPASLEISRSGDGGHIWIFFSTAIDASLSRKLGSALLTHAMDASPDMGLDSYDRLFPSQDTVPRKGGFGNLIALPLQKDPRKRNCSVFVDANFNPYQDQWAYLSAIPKMSAFEVEYVVSKIVRTGDLLGVRRSFDLQGDQRPWDLKPSESFCSAPIKGSLPESINVTLSNLLFIEKANVAPALLNRIIRIAAFHNPEFYKAQAMRFSTFDKPRLIHCAEGFDKYIAIPRGCLDDLKTLCNEHSVKISLNDRRHEGEEIKVKFQGELRENQKKAVRAVLKCDTGIICAATAFGKTVVAAHLIAKRKTNTLVIVHRKQLLNQWRERLATFLNVDIKDVGQIGGGKNKPTKIIDVAIIQSLNRKGEVKDIVAEYGHVIIDECHHLSAFSFEQVLRKVNAKYVLGLTATPERKDGHHPILFMQCGAIRYKMTAKEQAKLRSFRYIVQIRDTDVRFAEFMADVTIHELYQIIISSKSRNEQIVNDVVRVVKEDRSPLILTERVEHLEILASRLEGKAQHVVVLKGGMGVKQQRELNAYMASIPQEETRIILATGSYVGEGFDDSRLDTLFLAMPISWKGTLQQYVGRLHRLHEGKREVRVYDYVDRDSLVFKAMFKKRVKGYTDIGYEIHNEDYQDLGIE